mmetsp:Transcript_58781/g.138209  ORF Transcript_58781/g.138209 Transcript_58781/m.138209 type:complete len:81 (+) Transcript_58781:731-973(+)
MPVRAKRISPAGAVSYPRVLLGSVYCVPEATKALISIKRAKANGFKATFDDEGGDGFIDADGNLYPFTVGPNGLSYLLLR